MLYTNEMNRCQRSSEALLNVAEESYIESVSTLEVSKISKLFGINKDIVNSIIEYGKKLDEGFELWQKETLAKRDLGKKRPWQVAHFWFLFPDTKNCV